MRTTAATLCVGLSGLAMQQPYLEKLPDSPATLIEILKTGPGESYTISAVRVVYVKESDVPHLVSVLDSNEPCRFVAMAISSVYYPGKSTVGREAAYLVEGFWKRYYPTGLSSQQYTPDIEAMKRWHQVWSNPKNPRGQGSKTRDREAPGLKRERQTVRRPSE